MNLTKPSSDGEHPEQKHSLLAVATARIADSFEAAADLTPLLLHLDGCEQGSAASMPPLLHISATGKVLWGSSPALKLLRTYWDWTKASAQLPAALRGLLSSASGTRLSSPTQLSRKVLIVGKHGASLLVRLIEDNGRLWLLLDERSIPLNETPVQTHGLTKREAEVLRWLAAGKSNKDIGTILAISPRTVEKHVEQIYQRLGVETRTAAVAAFYLLNQDVPTSVLASSAKQLYE